MSFCNFILIVFLFFVSSWASASEKPGPGIEINYQEIRFSAANSEVDDIEKTIVSRLNDLHTKGYLNARLDSLHHEDTFCIAFICRGPRFYYQLENVNISPLVLNKLNIDQYFSSEPFAYQTLQIINHRLLRYYENNGYPFARLIKNNISIEDTVIVAGMNVDLMDFIVFDTLHIAGDVSISRVFLENHLGIRAGAPYSEKLVLAIEEKILYLGFTELDGSTLLNFAHQKASLHIPLKKKQSNQFDGIVGLVTLDDADNTLMLTGKLHFLLINALRSGEMIDLSWQGLGHGTQILNLKSAYPYPMGLPISVQGSFALHRQDSAWIQTSVKPALSIQTSPWLRIGVFANLQKNNLLSTPVFQNQGNTPLNLDFKARHYGLDFLSKSSGFDFGLLYPGQSALLSVSAGKRTILRNSRIDETVYESLQMQQTQYNIEVTATKRWRTSNNTTINLTSSNAFLIGKTFFENQMMRLGGFGSLLGYDEASILASSYTFANAEFRLFITERTFLSSFINGGWYERKIQNGYFNAHPVGVGSGLNLETQAGIFAIYVALGKQKNLPVELRNTKIHIGYVSVF
jgi:hypothetical protein